MPMANKHQIGISNGFASHYAKEEITNPLELSSYQEKKRHYGVLMRLLIEHIKQTGEFDYRSFELEQEITLSVLQKQRLMRLFIDYVKQTGEFDYPMVMDTLIELAEKQQQESEKPSNFNQQEQKLPSISTPTLKENEQENEQKEIQALCQEVETEILTYPLTFKTLLNKWVEVLRPTNAETNVRYLMEGMLTGEEKDHSFLIYDLKAKHQQLAKCLDRLTRIAYKYSEDLNTIPPGIARRSISKVISDLAYIRLYLEQQAQMTKIQQEVFLSQNPSVYLQRLNQYLDMLPELMGYLIHAFEYLLSHQSSNNGEEDF